MASTNRTATTTEDEKSQEQADQTPKGHLSPTQIQMFCRCPESYRRRYMEQELIPPGIAMLKGAAVHKAAEINYKQKLNTGEDLPAETIADTAADAMETMLRKPVLLTKEERSRGAAMVGGEAIDDAYSMADCYARQIAPEYQPAEVERDFRVRLSSLERDLVGVIDLIDSQDRVVDLKTAGRRKPQAEADSSIQFTAYACGFHALHNRQPAEMRMEAIIQSKEKTTRQVLKTHRDAADLKALAARMAAVMDAIRKGVFPPCLPGQWWCSDRFCGYYSGGATGRPCPYVRKGYD